jgi:hypothetical protein
MTTTKLYLIFLYATVVTQLYLNYPAILRQLLSPHLHN